MTTFICFANSYLEVEMTLCKRNRKVNLVWSLLTLPYALEKDYVILILKCRSFT
jgi:hypothetical protein